VDQEAERLLAIIKSHQQVARLLGNQAPVGFGVQATNSIRRLSSETKKTT
jgi:hypothetical protein